jgi:hypothetical protein
MAGGGYFNQGGLCGDTSFLRHLDISDEVKVPAPI